MYPGISIGIELTHLPGCVRAGAVNHNNFDIAHCLRDRSFESLGNKSLAVENWD
jgi:hypothetical protein